MTAFLLSIKGLYLYDLINFQQFMETTQTFLQYIRKKSSNRAITALEIRECEATGPNSFISWVDDKQESYDVSIQWNKNGVITQLNCDCGKAPHCNHIAALGIHLWKEGYLIDKKVPANNNSALSDEELEEDTLETSTQKTSKSIASSNKKEKEPAVSRKKKKADGPEMELLNSIDEDRLRQWVASQFKSTPALKLNFMHQFDLGQNNLDPERLTERTEEAVRSVIKKRKKASAHEIGQIVDLWKKIHQPLVQDFSQNLLDKQLFDGFYKVGITITEYLLSIKTTSKKLDSYFAGFLQQSVRLMVYQPIEFMVKWEKRGITWQQYQLVLEQLIQQLHQFHPDDNADGRVDEWIEFILTIQRNTFKRERRNFIDSEEVKIQLIDLLVKRKRLDDLRTSLFPYTYQNKYNIYLIRQLIQQGDYEKACFYCIGEIEKNKVPQFNIPYQNLLYEVADLSGNMDFILTMLMEQVETQFNYQAFLKVLVAYELKDLDIWLKSIVKKTETIWNRNEEAELIHITGLIHLQQYEKAIAFLGKGTREGLIIKFGKQLSQFNHNLFLETILSKPLSDDFVSGHFLYNHINPDVQNDLSSDENDNHYKKYRPEKILTDFIQNLALEKMSKKEFKQLIQNCLEKYSKPNRRNQTLLLCQLFINY